MRTLAIFCALMVPAIISAQNVCYLTSNDPFAITYEECTSSGCEEFSGFLVMDANWRWTHDLSSSTNCYTGNEWNENYCSDSESCSENCCIDGISSDQWSGTYGCTSSNGDDIAMKFKTYGPYSTNLGARVFLADSTASEYVVYPLLNREFTFTVDSSELGCGLNGAVYFVEMDADGGLSEYDGNDAGAAYGTGYCDAQCPHDVKFINGEVNCDDWVPSDNDVNSGTGYYGTCCEEMDIWEANSFSQAFTAHPCSIEGQYRCEGTECGDTDNDERYDGLCDKDGCDFASYRLGNTTFYGEGCTVDSSKEITVVTQFITDDGTDTGTLSEIRRIYVQDGVVIQNNFANVDGEVFDSITSDFCTISKEYFGDTDDFTENGGLTAVGEALGRGMVLALSLWDDHTANMLWLDSVYPVDADPDDPGVTRGPCPTDSGVPEDVESEQPDATVYYSAIRFGELDTTY